LCRLIGISCVAEVPQLWNVSRFLDGLGRPPHYAELRKVFDVLVGRLGISVPDLGAHTAAIPPG